MDSGIGFERSQNIFNDMKLLHVKRLHSGDEVTWNDPDNGECTRTFIISTIAVHGDVVRIVDRDGNYLECLAKELS